MRQKKRILSMLLLCSLLIPSTAAASKDDSALSDHATTDSPSTNAADTSTTSTVPTSSAKDGLHGVWVATVYNIDYPSKPGVSVEKLCTEADEILNHTVEMGLNAVFLQVRPSADAFYPSSVFPWSRYLTGNVGQAPGDDFDPLAYWVTAAHQRGLELHAWLNPYRITKAGKEELEALPSDSPAKQHPEWVVECENNYYFDPGLPSVQQLVVDGAVEIVENYDVDGIHLDDYFYPSTEFNDDDTYARYGGDFDNRADWRRDNVNTLIASLDRTLHEKAPHISFGVSPAGIWDNKDSNPRGSNTRGRSSYSEIYCDSLHWIETGTVDYICPQLYWAIGYSVADFAHLSDWWEKAVANTDVALYIGMGAYRMDEAEPGDTWYGSSELARQLKLLHNERHVQGEIYFSYASLMACPDAQELLAQTYTNASLRPYHPPAPVTPSEEKKKVATDELMTTFFTFITSLFG